MSKVDNNDDDDDFVEASSEQQVQEQEKDLGYEDEIIADVVKETTSADREILDDNVLRGAVQYFTNNFKGAEVTFYTYRKSDPLHALAYGVMGFLKAMMSFADEDMKIAEDRMKIAQSLAAVYFKQKGTLNALGKALGMAKWEPMKSEELDCAVVMAETSLLMALLLLVQDSMAAYLKAGLLLKRAWSTYKEAYRCITEVKDCKKIYNEHTIAGIQFGVGMLNNVMATLPPKLLKIVAVLGFPHSREEGLRLMFESFDQRGVRSSISGLSLLIHFVMFKSFFYSPDLDHDIERSEYILTLELQRFPGSAIHGWFHGRLLRSKRDLPAAIKAFLDSINAQNDWLQLKHLGFYDLGLTYLFNQQPAEAIPYFEKLSAESEWSKAFYAYFLAVCLYLTGKEADALKKFSQLETLQQRKLGGKVISEEQFVLRKAKTYCKGSSVALLLPGLELTYLWNGFNNLPKPLMQKIVDADILPALASMREKKNNNYIALSLLLLGAALRQLARPQEALKCFEEIEQMGDNGLITEEKYVLPWSTYERGSLLLLQGDVAAADKYLNKAREKYNDYNFEVKLHMRVHLSLQGIHKKK